MRLKLFVLLIAFAMLCGCGTKSNVTPILRGISFEADISYYNEKYICDTVIDSEGKFTMEFTYPDELSGLKIFFENDKANIEYMGLTYTPKNSSMPVGSVAQTLYDIIAKVEANDSTVSREGENCIADGRYNDTYFKLYFSPSGLPLSVLIPDDSFKIQFNNLTVL